jgi:hypothetical protein
MKKMTFHENFQPQNCPSNSTTPIRAATIGAGVQVFEMYQEMDKYGAVVVGGANPVSIRLNYLSNDFANQCGSTDCGRGRLVHRWWTWSAFE